MQRAVFLGDRALEPRRFSNPSPGPGVVVVGHQECVASP
jgi:hypothetical protein